MVCCITNMALFDTLDNTKEFVSEQYLINVLKLGISIQGVSLSSDGSFRVYDFREVNRQRLNALRGISIIIDDMNNLTGIKGVGLDIDLEVSAYANGLNSLIKLRNISGVLRLDNFLFIHFQINYNL